MAKKAHFKYKEEFRDMSGKNSTPGQYRLDLDEEKLGLIEQKPQLCKPYYAQKYWEAFKEFLDASGVFNRTWYLYKQIEKDPSPEELNEKIDEATRNGSTREYIDKLKSQLDDVVKRLAVMNSKQECNTKEQLFDKAEKEWKDYKAKLKNLIFYSRKANVPITAKENSENASQRKSFRGMLYAFVLLDDSVRGSCRREYYRKKYVDPASKRCKETGYSDPISIYDIEKDYKADEKWQEKYLRRKKKK